MELYRDLQKRSLLISLKLSLPLILISVILAPYGFELLTSYGFAEAFPHLLLSLPWGIWGIFRIVYALCGGYQTRVRNYIAAAPDPTLTAAQLQKAYSEAEDLDRIRIAGPWTLIQKGPATYIYETQEILWAYQYTYTFRYGLIPFISNYLTIGLFGGLTKFRMPGRAVEESLRAFEIYAPFVVRGYSEQLAGLYKNNRQEFIRAVRQRQLQKDVVLAQSE